MQIKNLLNSQFGRLTVIKRAENPGTRKNDTAAWWLCRCSCGKEKVIRGYSLSSEKTKSCGCIVKECAHLDEYKKPKYDSEIMAAMKIHRRRYLELEFEDFFRLAKLQCYYCGDLPKLINKARQKDNSKVFIYNTLDRKDSSLGHTINNVVPACLICNMAKLQRSLEEFNNYIKNIINIKRMTIEEYRESSTLIEMTKNSYLLSSVNYAFINYRDEDLTIKQFYQLTQLNCYYCGYKPINKRIAISNKSSEKARKMGTFIYNGLDRVDNNYGHNYNNVISCCKWCNSAKGQLTLEEFYKWIDRLKINFHRQNQD